MLFGCADDGPDALPTPSGPPGPDTADGFVDDGFPSPQVLRSRDGRLAVTLQARRDRVDIGDGHVLDTVTYDGTIPGFTWEVDPGDVLRVDLVNDLPPLPDDTVVDLVRPHEWTHTNLHTHGFHVSPSGTSDNIFQTVRPGARWGYEFQIPEDHPGGLFWYHPHRHGGVAQQVRGGMAGAIVVRGSLDRVPEVAAARERIMVLQALEVSDDDVLLDPIPHPTKTQAFFPRDQIHYTLNGRLLPEIRMYPGEVQRWRLLNAAEGKFMSLTLQGHALHQLAWDGLNLAAPEPTDTVMLSAANRVDVLVKAVREPGVYDLVLTPGSSQHPNIPGMPTQRNPDDGTDPDPSGQGTFNPSEGELATRTIARLVVEGTGPDMALPAELPAFDPPILPIANRRELTYSVERDDDQEFISFGVNGTAFDPSAPAYQVRLGTAEEWTLVNAVDDKLADHAHVFHIHVNPFKVTKINGVPLETPLWRDTFVLTGRDGDSITFEMNFVDFAGRFVQHCHVLTHEDLGMMETIEVVR